MAEPVADKAVKPSAANADAMAQALAYDPAEEKSWGEKYKGKAYHFTRNWLVNYIINFIASAALTYSFDSSKTAERFRGWCAEKVQNIGKYGIPAPVAKFLIKFMTRTQLLLCGGHLLQPVMKWMKDNRRRLEFRMGHWLDSLQELVGFGNAASKRSTEEYNRVSSLISVGDHNRKQTDSVTPHLSDEDKLLLAKHEVNENLEFIEHKLSWGKVIKARLTGVLFTTLTSVGMALSSSLPDRKPWGMLKFEEKVEEPLGIKFGDKFVSRIPILSWLFRNDLDGTRKGPMPDEISKVVNRPLTGHELFGKYFVDDMVFTAMSKLGFDKAEKRYDKMAENEEQQAEEKATRAISRAPRRHIVTEAAPKSFSEREDKKIAEPVVQGVGA